MALTPLFIAQKIVLRLLLPPSGPFLLILGGSVLSLAGRRKKWGRRLTVAGVLLLYAFSTGLVAHLLIRPLEAGYPLLDRSSAAADAVVVLTAGVRDLSPLGREMDPDPSSLVRLREGIELQRATEAPLVICGGPADPSRPGLSTGLAMARAALALGVDSDRLIVEDESLNTLEGAQRVRELVDGRGLPIGKIALVTSAFHMGRSVRFFEGAGFDVLPAPTDFHGDQVAIRYTAFIPDAEALRTSATAIYEYLVRLRYLLPL